MGNNWQNKQILVTGSAGFISSHLVERLLDLGATVRALVHYNSRGDIGHLKEALGDPIKSSNLEVVFGDLRDLATVKKVSSDCNYIFHLGALIAIPYSYINPSEVVQTNIVGTLNVLLAARETKPEKIIHTSSSEVYGTALRVPIDEDHPLHGQSPYSASKIGADKLAEAFYLSYNLPIVTLRPFNTYGPRQSARAVIPTIISQALTSDRVQLGNLETRRDLTFVSDTVEGFIKVAETPSVEGQTFNLGTGSEISIGDLVSEIEIILGRKLDVVVDANRIRPEKSEVMRLLSDNSKAKRLLGWNPKYTLHQGLEKTIEWVEKNLNLFTPEKYQI